MTGVMSMYRPCGLTYVVDLLPNRRSASPSPPEPAVRSSSKHKLLYVPTFTKRRTYLARLAARPVGSFFFSCLGTLGVCPRTLPARAREP